MLRQWSNTTWKLIRTVSQMVILCWQAQPQCFTGLLVVLLVQSLIPLATAWIMKGFFDVLSQGVHQQGGFPEQHLAILLIAQAGLIVTSQLISPINQYLRSELARRLTLHIQTSIYKKLTSFIGLAYFEDPHFQNTIQLASKGALISPLQSLTVVTSLFQGTITVATFLGVLITLNPLLAGMVGVSTLPHLYVQVRFGRQRFGVASSNTPKERRASYYGQVLSWATFAKEVRLFNLGDYFLSSFGQTTREIQQAQRMQQRRELVWQLPLALLASIITAGAFVVVILQAVADQISLGDVALYTSAVTSVQGALLSMVAGFSQMSENILFYREYTNLQTLQDPLQLRASAHAVPRLTTSITLRDVSFRYDEQHAWVLRHVDLVLPAGKCLALVGMNGAGKTTLVKLLARLYEPTEGQILWNGVDLRNFDPQEVRQRIGVIFQDFAHYSLTVQHNIGLGNVVQVEEQAAIQQAAAKAGIHEHIAALPHGYQSFLGSWLAGNETGIELSGGEWQKIALARMFMRDAELLILDEPTASLDAKAEYDLYRHFQELMQGRTSLLITHRFSTVRMADAIAVIEEGQIKEYGTHDELITRGGIYASLYAMQAQQYK